MGKISLLDSGEVGQDQSRVLGGDTGPPVPHTSHLFDDASDVLQILKKRG